MHDPSGPATDDFSGHPPWKGGRGGRDNGGCGSPNNGGCGRGGSPNDDEVGGCPERTAPATPERTCTPDEESEDPEWTSIPEERTAADIRPSSSMRRIDDEGRMSGLRPEWTEQDSPPWTSPPRGRRRSRGGGPERQRSPERSPELERGRGGEVPWWIREGRLPESERRVSGRGIRAGSVPPYAGSALEERVPQRVGYTFLYSENGARRRIPRAGSVPPPRFRAQRHEGLRSSSDRSLEGDAFENGEEDEVGFFV